MVSVREVDVRVAGLTEHGSIPGCYAAVRVTGRVVLTPVRFDLNDPPDQCCTSNYPYEAHVEKRPCRCYGSFIVKESREGPD